MKHSQELIQKRNKIVADQIAMYERAKAEKRSLTEDENTQYERMDNDYTALSKEIERAQELEKKQELIAQKDLETQESTGVRTDERLEKELRAFAKFLRNGAGALSEEERQFMKRGTNPQTTSDAAGGYTIPKGFADRIEVAMKAFGGVRDVATIIRTETGNPLYYPNVDDTGTSGALMTEGTAPNVADMTFGNTIFNAHTFTSQIVKLTMQLAQDSAFDLESWLATQLGIRIGRITNTYYTTGSGSSQPKGVVTAASAGVTGSTTNTITKNNLFDLKHTVDPAYRTNGSWMFNDSTFKAIKKLSIGSSDDTPLWQPNLFRDGAPATIDGDRYTINQDMASIGSGNKCVLYGDFSKYVIREATGMELVVMRERFVDALTIGFLAFRREDGNLPVASTTAPIKYFRNTTT